MAAAQPVQTPVEALGSDKLPSGSWTLGPLVIAWSLESLTEIDVKVTVFSIDVDNMKAKLSPTNTKVSNDIDVLNVVKGTLTLEAKYDQGAAVDGLYLEGQLKGPSFDTGALNVRIVTW